MGKLILGPCTATSSAGQMTADTLLSSNNAYHFCESMQWFGHLGKTCYKASIVQYQPQKLHQLSDISGYRVSRTLSVLEGSGANLSLEIMKPRYRTNLHRNEHSSSGSALDWLSNSLQHQPQMLNVFLKCP